MKNLKEFIRKLDCHGRLADLAMTGRRESSDNLFNLKNLSPYRCYARTYLGWLRSKAVTTAFTMAEILLSLTIIGIVAAITLPSLTANFQDKAFNSKRQALHARLSQAFRLMDYNDYIPINKEVENTDTGNITYPNIDKFMDELSHSLSIKVVSDPEIIFGTRDYDGNGWYQLQGDINAWWYNEQYSKYFQTVNGESIGILFTNPRENDKKYPGASLCFFVLYDLNGAKGPNKIGKDLGLMGAYYSDKMELYAPMLGAVTSNMENDNYDPGDSNSQKYKYPDYRLASPEELLILFPSNSFFPGQSIDWQESTLCSIDGYRYSWYSLYNASTYDPSSENLSDARIEADGDCLYMLVTNDGSAPKNGVTYDINSGEAGE